MSRMGKFDDGEIKSFLSNLQNSLHNQDILQAMISEMNDVGNLGLIAVKERTPTDKGRLKNAWQKISATKRGNAVVVELVNNTEYAASVEFGHRQKVGRYVPAINARLVTPFVPGKFMLKNSMTEIEAIMTQRVDKRFTAEINKLFGK